MAKQQPKQSLDYKNALGILLNRHLAGRGWSPAQLARASGVPKPTVWRMVQIGERERPYHPQIKTIIAIALALRLSEEEFDELFDAAYPGWLICRESIRKGRSVDDANEILFDNGLPLLING